MYRDDQIILPVEKYPTDLREEIEKMDSAYDQGEEAWYSFCSTRDFVEIIAKSYCINGRISEDDLELIYRKYGLR